MGFLKDNSGLLGGIAQGLGNIISTGMTNKANRELAEYSFEQQKQMLAEQNEYNSPKAQMARYEEAGLNPHLIYGSGTQSAGNQQVIPKYEAPTMQAPNISNVLSNVVDTAVKLKMAKEDIRLKEIEQSNKLVENGLMNQEFMRRQRNNILEGLLLGVPDQFNGYSEEQMEAMKNSPIFGQRVAEAKTAVEVAALTDAKKRFQELKVDEQSFVVNNIQPLTEEYMILRNEGVSKQNAMLEVRKSLNESLAKIGGEKGAALIWLVIRSLLVAL